MYGSPNLPFERGTTYFDGDSSRATSTGVDQILGQTFEVCDNKDGFGSSLKNKKVLVVMRNDSTGNLTVGRGIRMDSAASHSFYRVAKGHVAAQGGFGLAIDDAHGLGNSIIPNDLFYAVLEGPNKSYSATDTTSAGMIGHAATTWDATGRIEAAGSADYVNGNLDEPNGTSSTNSSVLVWHTAQNIF